MAIYIKGMEMPKSCGECHFCHAEGFRSWCCPTEREDILFDAIPEWCPLTEVPEPHGRLIDESLIKTVYGEAMTTRYQGYISRTEKITHTDAPTVIEAEGE